MAAPMTRLSFVFVVLLFFVGCTNHKPYTASPRESIPAVDPAEPSTPSPEPFWRQLDRWFRIMG